MQGGTFDLYLDGDLFRVDITSVSYTHLLTADLIDITDKDFKTVNAVSIGIIFVIIMLLFKSISLPIILVGVIEFAIFVNMGIPYLSLIHI